eukprot:1393069-Amorphochlora_amoeboformis.AAC.1
MIGYQLGSFKGTGVVANLLEVPALGSISWIPGCLESGIFLRLTMTNTRRKGPPDPTFTPPVKRQKTIQPSASE